MRWTLLYAANLLFVCFQSYAFLMPEMTRTGQREYELALFSYGLDANPFAAAACSGDLRAMNFFMARDGADKIDEDGLTALAVAALRADALAARRLMLLGANPYTPVTHKGVRTNTVDLLKKLSAQNAQYAPVLRVVNELAMMPPSRLYVELFFEAVSTQIDEATVLAARVREQTINSNMPGFFNALDRLAANGEIFLELVRLLCKRLATCSTIVDERYKYTRVMDLRHRVSVLCFELANYIHQFVAKTTIIAETRQNPFAWQQPFNNALQQLMQPSRCIALTDKARVKKRPVCKVRTFRVEPADAIAAK